MLTSWLVECNIGRMSSAVIKHGQYGGMKGAAYSTACVAWQRSLVRLEDITCNGLVVDD